MRRKATSTYECAGCPVFGRTHYPALDERVAHDQAIKDVLNRIANTSAIDVEGASLNASSAVTDSMNDGRFTSVDDLTRGMSRASLLSEQTAPFNRRINNRNFNLRGLPVPTPPTSRVVKALQRLDKVEKELEAVEAIFSSFDDDGMELRAKVNCASRSLASCEEHLMDVSRVKDEQVKPRYSEILSRYEKVKTVLQPYIDLQNEYPEHANVADSTTPILIHTSHLFSPTQLDQSDTIVQVVTLLVIICNVMIGASERQCMFILHVITFLTQMVMSLSVPTPPEGDEAAEFPPLEKHILNHLPLNLDQAYHFLGQGIGSTPYAICPSCLATYSGTYSPSKKEWTYQAECSQPDLRKGERCGAELLEETKAGVYRPRLSFVVGSMHDYISRLFSDATAEKHILDSLKDNDGEDDMTNVFTANFFRDEPWNSFLHQNDRIPLSFQLHWDTYNPEGSNRRSDSRSIGVFTLACLNLPVSLRYLPEYLFVISVVPVHPSLDEINHFLRPIVDRLVEGWNPGIRLTQTALSPTGRTLQLGLILSLNDLPAARQIAGLAGPRSNCHCSVCTIRTENAADTDLRKWPRRDPMEMKKIATQWRDATTIAERDKIFKDHGIRWSELWRLPYWDPTRMLVIDSMHALLLGVVAYHCRYVLGFDSPADPTNDLAFEQLWTTFDDETHDPKYRYKPEDLGKLKNLQLTLQRPRPDAASFDDLEKYLGNRPKAFLQYVVHCDLRDRVPALWRNKLNPREKDSIATPPQQQIQLGNYEQVPPNKKEDYVRVLMEWRRQKPAVRPPSEIPLNTSRPVTATTETIQHIQHVISQTTKPSWVNTVPKDFGLASAGTVKADEWRTLSTIYLPIALVTLWGDDDNKPPPSNSHLLRVLDHSMDLFQAVTLAMRYRMSTKRADTYLALMKKYINRLHDSSLPGHMYAHLHGQAARPNLHASLHIHDFLLLFGPVISWWCFPFERLIGLLQSIPTNNQPGAAERTVFKTFHRMGTVRRWLRQRFQGPWRSFCSFYDEAFLPVGIPDLERKAVERAVAYLKAEALEGRFSPSRTHHGNSVIMYNVPGVIHLFAGEVQNILRASNGATFKVKRHEPLPKTHYDPFIRYPQFPARTFSSRLSETVEDVDESQVHSHAMRFHFSHERDLFVYLSRQ